MEVAKVLVVPVLVLMITSCFVKCDFYGSGDYDLSGDSSSVETTATTTSSTAALNAASNTACGVQTVAPQLNFVRKIVGGRQANQNSFPWQVLLEDSDGNVLCGGSIIDETTVLTAAHCVVEVNGTNIPLGQVWAGLHNLGRTQNAVSKNIARVAYYSEYLTNTGDDTFYDIALLKLDSALDFSGNRIKPICLPGGAEAPAVGEACVVTGWGHTVEDPETDAQENPQNLLQAEIRIVSDASCTEMLGEGSIDHDSNICAGGNDGPDTCQGDSGGPLQCKRAGGSWYLAGITSWGVECGGDTPGVYAEVRYFLDWIQRNT